VRLCIIHVFWLHDSADQPVELISELDYDSWEVRKIEIFPDGIIGVADSNISTHGTDLGLEPVPPFEEIDQNPEFRLFEISREEFGAAWVAAKHASEPKTAGVV